MSDTAIVGHVTIRATGEVRDAEGNLLSSAPYEETVPVTAAQLEELGIEAPPNKEQ
jgi:hypothetical protein